MTIHMYGTMCTLFTHGHIYMIQAQGVEQVLESMECTGVMLCIIVYFISIIDCLERKSCMACNLLVLLFSPTKVI